MERRFQARLDELLGDAEVPLYLVRGALPRLARQGSGFIFLDEEATGSGSGGHRGLGNQRRRQRKSASTGRPKSHT